MKLMRKKLNKKGFSLIELIVVIAILAIIAAVAIPRFAGIQERSSIRADATTAAEIINACRIQETEVGTTITDIDQTGIAADPGDDELWPEYMIAPTNAQSPSLDGSNDTFDIGAGGNAAYTVTFVAEFEGANVTFIVRENVDFDITNPDSQ